MRTRQTMTVSLPPEMVEKVDEVRKEEHRTRSELVRQALRTYFNINRFAVVEPTKSELTVLRRGRAAFRRGDSVSLDQFIHELEPTTHRTRAKRPQKATRKR